LIYANVYDLKDIRFSYFLSTISTGIAACALYLFHPFLPALLAYDAWLLAKTAFMLKETVRTVLLDRNKQHVYINKLNPFGFMTDFSSEHKFALR